MCVKAIEIVVAALERAEIGQCAQMPFADQYGLIAGPLQDRRQGRMTRRKADLSWRTGAQRLFQTDRQPVLVTPGDQRHARRGANRGIGIRLAEAHALGRNAIDIGRAEIPTTVARHVRIAEIVGENEQDVGFQRRHPAPLISVCAREGWAERRQGNRSRRGPQHRIPRADIDPFSRALLS